MIVRDLVGKKANRPIRLTTRLERPNRTYGMNDVEGII